MRSYDHMALYKCVYYYYYYYYSIGTKSLTLNDLERRYFTELISFRAHCVKVVEDIRKHFATEM